MNIFQDHGCMPLIGYPSQTYINHGPKTKLETFLQRCYSAHFTMKITGECSRHEFHIIDTTIHTLYAHCMHFRRSQCSTHQCTTSDVKQHSYSREFSCKVLGYSPFIQVTLKPDTHSSILHFWTLPCTCISQGHICGLIPDNTQFQSIALHVAFIQCMLD